MCTKHDSIFRISQLEFVLNGCLLALSESYIYFIVNVLLQNIICGLKHSHMNYICIAIYNRCSRKLFKNMKTLCLSYDQKSTTVSNREQRNHLVLSLIYFVNFEHQSHDTNSFRLNLHLKRPNVTSLGLSSTSDVITFDQNWHHLYSTSAGGKDISNDVQIRVIGPMEPGICTKMLKQLSEKLGAKFPATTPGCSVVKIARLDDAFLEVF